MLDKIATTFETYQNSRHGYNFTHVVVRTQYEENTRAKREGTVDNKDGYGTEDAAQRMGMLFQELLNRGYEVHYDHCCAYDGVYIHIEWQHYDYDDGTHSYCEPTFVDLGRSFTRIQLGVKFLKRLGASIERERARECAVGDYKPSPCSVGNRTFEEPERVLGALRRMKGVVEVELLKDLGDLSRWVPVTQPRQSQAA